MQKLYVGIDLHSTNLYLGIYDEQDREVLMKKKLPTNLVLVLHYLAPYRESIQGIVVESTYNWYWLVDGLMDHGYTVYLANPAGNQQYSGLKHTDDQTDCQWLAHLLRLGILATGYIYPREERPFRDLLRKRIRLVQHRTAHILSVQNQIIRNTGTNLNSRKIVELTDEKLIELLDDEDLVLAPRASLAVINTLNEHIESIEKTLKARAKLRKEFELLKTVYGVGQILGLVIMYETGDINRFDQVGEYCSYARCVTSRRMSNDKKKGENNTKCGNRYLAWAFVEAANMASRYYPDAHAFVQRKTSKKNYTLGIKALGHKLARASYYVMRDQVEFDPKKLFG